jgi:hypothetical protein
MATSKASEGVEQAPELSKEDEEILDRVWDTIAREDPNDPNFSLAGGSEQG